MRLLWLSHFVPYPPTGHGALQRTHHLLRQASTRHEIHLIALCPPSTFPSQLAISNAARELSALTASVDVFPLATDRFGLRRILRAASSLVRPTSFWEKRYFCQRAYERLHDLTQSRQFEVVHVDTVFLAPYLTAIPDIPVVLNHHNVESHLLRGRARSEGRALLRVLFEREARKVARLERNIAVRAAQNLVVSELDGTRLRETAPDAKTTTVANGVDVEFFRPTTANGAANGTLIFAGSMNWFPNRDAMIFFVSEIWPRLLEDDPGRRMTVIGRDPPAALLEEARDPRLRVLGFVEDVRTHMEAAAIYLCPIRVGGGTRLKILDALAMARPLVSTDMAVEGLGLVEGKHFLAANTPPQFVGQIRRLEADPELRRRLGEAGRAFVTEHYSWNRVGESLDAAYQKAMCATRNSSGNRIPSTASMGSTGR